MHMPTLSIRIDPRNPDHHLWNNNGLYWTHYTVYPTAVTTKRVRASLHTHDIHEARRRRDELFRKLHREEAAPCVS